ncbi:MAG TPA: AMP-binding protein, partial [Acidimicrobiales bacterium]|nr:AMP-binding protein [Acidimicrobiales bacterium]
MPTRGVTAHAQASPGRPAVVAGERVLSYGELDRRSRRLAAALAERGAGQDRPVAAVLPNGAEILEVATAASMLGAPYLPVNWHLKADELAFILRDSGAGAVVTHRELAGRVRGAGAGPGGPALLVVGDDYEDAISAAPERPELAASSGPSFVFYTSGTTARPKGVVHRRPDPAQAAAAQEGQVSLWWWSPDDV